MVGAREERCRLKKSEDQRKVTNRPSSVIGAVGQVEDFRENWTNTFDCQRDWEGELVRKPGEGCCPSVPCVAVGPHGQAWERATGKRTEDDEARLEPFSTSASSLMHPNLCLQRVVALLHSIFLIIQTSPVHNFNLEPHREGTF